MISYSSNQGIVREDTPLKLYSSSPKRLNDDLIYNQRGHSNSAADITPLITGLQRVI